MRMKDKIETKNGKIDVLMNYWDKLYGQIMNKAIHLKDKYTLQLCSNIALIPKKVQYACLRKYI